MSLFLNFLHFFCHLAIGYAPQKTLHFENKALTKYFNPRL